MDDWRLDPVVARVVAWHNRHPLARRIGPQHVQGLGFVALPHVVPGAEPGATGNAGTVAAPQVSLAPAGGAPGRSLRERALAQAQAQGQAQGHGQGQARQPPAAPADPPPVAGEPPLPPAARKSQLGSAARAAFSERFIDGLAPTRVARWAARHAHGSAIAPAGGPMRQVAVDDALVQPGSGVVMLYAMTAAVQAGGARTRLLVGPEAHSPILGRRLWSPPRAVAGGGGAVAGLVLALLAAAPAPEPAELGSLPQPIAVTAAAAADTPAPVADMAAAELPAEGASSAPAAPRAVEPRRGHVELPPRRADLPGIDSAKRAAAPPASAPEEVKNAAANKTVNAAVNAAVHATVHVAKAIPAVPAAAAAAATAATAAAAAAASTAASAMPVVATRSGAAEAEAHPLTPAAAPSAAAAAVPAGAVWALTTRPLRTPTESRRLRRALDELLREQGKETLRVEVLPAGDDWRVVGWPFMSRNEAERARALLLARGLRLEVVNF